MLIERKRRSKRAGQLALGSAGRRKGGSDAPRAKAARGVRELRTLQGLRTIFASARLFDTEVRRTGGISGSQLWALAEIAGRDGMTVNGLAERMALHQSTASNLINALVERGMIRRLRDGADQRVVHLHVSAEGKRMLLRVPGPHAGLLVDAIRRLRDRQLDELGAALEALVGIMQRTAADAAGETLLGE